MCSFPRCSRASVKTIMCSLLKISTAAFITIERFVHSDVGDCLQRCRPDVFVLCCHHVRMLPSRTVRCFRVNSYERLPSSQRCYGSRLLAPFPKSWPFRVHVSVHPSATKKCPSIHSPCAHQTHHAHRLVTIHLATAAARHTCTYELASKHCHPMFSPGKGYAKRQLPYVLPRCGMLS